MGACRTTSINAFVVRLFIKFSLTAHGAAVAWLFHRVPIPRLKLENMTYGEHASYWRTHGEADRIVYFVVQAL